MRFRRVKAEGQGFYHIVSRTLAGLFLFGTSGKRFFEILRKGTGQMSLPMSIRNIPKGDRSIGRMSLLTEIAPSAIALVLIVGC